MRAQRSRLAVAAFGAYASVQLRKFFSRMMLYSGNGHMAPGPVREARN